MKQKCRRWRSVVKWARCVKVGGRRHEITGCAMFRRVRERDGDGDGDGGGVARGLWVGWGISWEIKIHPKIDEKTADELKRTEKKIGYLVVVCVCEREKEIARACVSLCVCVGVVGRIFLALFQLEFFAFFLLFFWVRCREIKTRDFSIWRFEFWLGLPNHPPPDLSPSAADFYVII